MQVTVNRKPPVPVKQPVESITLVCTVEEAQAIQDIFGVLNPDRLDNLADRSIGKGAKSRLRTLSATYRNGNSIASVHRALSGCDALKRYTEV